MLVPLDPRPHLQTTRMKPHSLHLRSCSALQTTLAALWFAGLALNTVSAGLIINGGFESPGLANPSDYLFLPHNSTIVPGWVSVDNVQSGGLLVDNALLRAPYYGFPASEGQHFIYIDNHNGPFASLNGIYQDFATVTGQQYVVTFDASTELAFGVPALLGVSAGDTVMHYTLPNVPGYFTQPQLFTGWSSYAFTFLATASTTRLQFFDEGLQVGGDIFNGNASPLLDNVNVEPIPGKRHL